MRTEMEKAPNVDVFLHANVTKLITNNRPTSLRKSSFQRLMAKGPLHVPDILSLPVEV